MRQKLCRILLLIPLILLCSFGYAAVITSNGTGQWNQTGTWSGGQVPGINDDVIIRGGDVVTVTTASVTVQSLTLGVNTSNNTATLTVNSGLTVTVTGNVTVINNIDRNNPTTLSGAGGLSCNNLIIGGTSLLLTSSRTTTFTSSITTLSVAGDVTITSIGLAAFNNTASFFLNSGTATVGGQIRVNGGALGGSSSVATFSLTQASPRNATLNLSGATPFSTSNSNVITFSNTGSSSATTVNYNGSAQNVFSASYDNLTLSGSGLKTLPSVATSINRAFTMSGTASANAAAALSITGNVTLGSGTSFNAGNFTHNVGGSWTNNGSTFTPASSTINFNGSTSSVTLGGTVATPFNLITANKSSASNTITSSGAAFSANGVTITTGTLTLTASDADYVVNGNLTVNTNGTLNHNVDFDATTRSLRVTGNVVVDGIYAYGVSRSRLQMSTGGTNIRSGNNASSKFRVVALSNPSGTISASGRLVIDDWFLVGNDVAGGTFNTNGNALVGQAMYISGGTVNANSAVTLSAGLVVGNNSTGINNLSGTYNLNGGSLVVDAITIAEAGNGSPAATLNQASGTTITLTNDFRINAAGTYNCTGSPVLNLLGDWDNNGTYNAATSTVNLNGTLFQELRGSAETVFYNLNNANATTAGVALSTDPTSISISNNLNFFSSSNGKIVTNSNIIYITKPTGLNTAITGANSSRYVVGNLSFAYPAGNTANITYPIGTSTNYAPATMSVNGVSGTYSLIASVSSSSLNENTPIANSSGISLTNRAPAYWTLSSDGGGTISDYSASFNFSNLSAGGNGTAYKLRFFNGSWSDIASASSTASATTGTGLTDFGEYLAGEANPLVAVAASDDFLCSGDNGAFNSGSTSSPSPAIKWQRSVDGIAPFVDITTSLDAATTYTGFNTDNLLLSSPGTALDNYVYRAVYTNINGTTTSGNARLRFTTRPTSVLSGSQTACSGATVPLTVVLTGTAPWSITYTNGTTPVTVTGITASPYTLNVSTTATATFTITSLSDLYCTGTSLTGSATITVYPTPVFTQQPAAATTICQNGSASFTIAAVGNGTLSYQWSRNGTALTNTGSISGATSPTITITGAALADAGNYVCTVTDACGINTPSNAASLTVNANASVANAGPDQNGTPTCGIAILNATTPAVGTGTWSVFSGTGGSFNSTTNPAATFTGVPGNTYTLRWTVNSNNCNTNFASVIITLNPRPAVTNPNTSNVCSTTPGSQIALTATVPSNFSWTVGTITGTITGAAAGSGTVINLSALSNLTNNPGTVQYLVTPTSIASGCVGAVYTITVTVNPEPVIGNQTPSAVCSGAGFSLSPTGTGVSAGTVYRWNAPVVTGGMTGGAAASGQATIGQVLINPTNTNQTATYTVTPSTNGCDGNSFTVTVTVRPVPTASTTTTTQTICSASSITSIAITNPNSVSGTTFSWSRDNTTNLTGTVAASGTGSPVSGTLINNTNTQQTATFTLSATANGCTGTATAIAIVNPVPTISVLPATQTLCSGNNITGISITNPNNVSGTTFAWTRTNTTNITGPGASGSGNSISGSVTNTTSPGTQQQTVFTVTATAGSCSTQGTATVIVNPTPVVSITNNAQTLCSGVGIASMTISSNVASSTFAWNRTNTTNLTGVISGTTATISGTLTNVTNVQQSTTFTATATGPAAAGSCAGTATATRIVNPTPLIANRTTSICSGTAFTTPANNSPTTIVPAGTTYTWTITNNNNITGQSAQTNATSLSQTLNNNTTSNQNITYTATPTAGTCAGASFTTAVTVFPAPTVNAISNIVTCATYSRPGITFASNLTNATFSWTSSEDIGFGTSGNGNIPAFIAVDPNPDTFPTTATITVRASLNNCTGVATTFTIRVNPTAIPSLVTNYCFGRGLISLTPSVSPNMFVTKYFWNSGGALNDNTNDSLYVDVASTYYVTITNTYGCQSTDSVIVAEELVSNGNFESGNTGFSSEYGYATGGGSLIPEGLYSVVTDGQSVHPNFWGNDHTSGLGRYLIVNGAPTAANLTVIWQQPTITVRRNTDYYFAAWARSVNNVAPYARLRFRVNGQQVGTIDTLVSQPNAGPYVWSRFYGIWNSGNSDTALISIVNLETNRDGNDFGLDDISFGTLAAVPFTVLAVNSVGGTGCIGKTITLSTSVTAGLAPFTYQWTGPNSFSASSSTATITNASVTNAGKYFITVKDKYGCPITDSTALTINPQSTITGPAVSGTNNQTVCINNPIVNITYATSNATGATLTGLPTNISGLFSSNSYTVSGTPNVAGTYTYKIKTTAVCPDSVSGSLVVQQNATLTLTSGNPNPAAFCVGLPLSTNIVYTAGGVATNVTVSGLPPGMQGVYNSTNKTFTISGTPTVGSVTPYAFTVTATGSNCVNQQLTGTITVTPNGDIALSSGTASQTICVNNLITPIVYTVSGTGTSASLSTGSFPTGVTGLYNSTTKQFTISGTPSVSGSFPYTIRVSGSGCTNNQLSGIITVTANGTISLTSVGTSSNQTICIGSNITSITYQYGGTSTGINVTGLPAGLTTNVAGNVLTISGQPTVNGTFNYTVNTSGSTCINPQLTGTIRINGNDTITLNSANATQTRCVNNAIAPIIYTISGAATGVTVTGLPPGVTGLLSGNVLTISGIPTIAGDSIFTVRTTGSVCSNAQLTGRITTNADATLALTTANASQTVCINNPIGTIRFNVGGAGTNATVTGLPAGLGTNFAAGVLTISGSPTASGTFNYTVSTSGSLCVNPQFTTGVITVNPNAAITTTTPTAETRCVNSSFTTRVYNIANATGITISSGSFPPGVTGIYNSTNNTYTITGAPTAAASGTYSYTLTTTGGLCQQAIASGTYTVNIASTISRIGVSPVQACIGSSVLVQFQLGGGATGATISGSLPPNVSGSYNSTTRIYTVSGTPLSQGASSSYAFTVTATGSVCNTPTATATINLSSPHTLTRTSSAATANQTICEGSNIASITYTFGGGATGVAISGLPNGVTFTTSGKNVTISGRPTVTGTYNYVINTTGSCTPANATGVIVINANSNLNLISAVTTTNQRVCINTGITEIEYQFTGLAANVTITGLPTGVTYEIVGNSITITGSPSVGGVFPYTINNIGVCTQSSTSGTLTIPNSTPGLWTGLVDNDWFNCANWGNGIVPDRTVDVVIPDNATVNVVIDTSSIYVTPDGKASAKSITVGKNLTFTNGSVLSVAENLTVRPGGSINMTAGGDIELAGNWTNNAGTNGLIEGIGTVTLNGAGLQTITGNETFANLIIDQETVPGRGVNIASNVTVSKTLTLNNGVVNTLSEEQPSLGLLTLGPNSPAVAGNPGAVSYINGQLAKEFTSIPSQPYVLPVGKSSATADPYRPASVLPAGTGTGTTTFTAEYQLAVPPSPDNALGNVIGLATKEYWQIDRTTTGTAFDAKVILDYKSPGSGNWSGPDPEPCSTCPVGIAKLFESPGNIFDYWNFSKLGGFDGSLPEFRYGNDNGPIYSDVFTSFGAFGFAYGYDVILAVKLISFEARKVNVDGVITWKISGGEELNHFELEGSKDGVHFDKIAEIAEAGKEVYTYIDRGLLAGLHFYRLVLVPKNNRRLYSKIVVLTVGKEPTRILGLRATVVTNQLHVKIYSAISQFAHAEVFDAAGHLLGEYKGNLKPGNNEWPVNTNLPLSGMYFIRVTTDDDVRGTLKFFRQ